MDQLRLPSSAFYRDAYDPIGAWGDDTVIESISYGRILQPIEPEAYTPALLAPLPIRGADGAALGTLRIGTPITTRADGALTVHLGKVSATVQSSVVPTVGRTYPVQPEPSAEGDGACFPADGVLFDAKEGSVIAKNQTPICQLGWRAVGTRSGGWQQVVHLDSGLQGWLGGDDVDAAVGYQTLIGGIGAGIGGVGNVTRKSISSPRYLYEAPNGAVIGYLDGGTYIVDEAREDGWWQTVVATSTGTRAVWFPPDPADEEAPEREGIGGCSAVGGGGLWLVGLFAAGLRRSGRSARRTGDRRG